MKRYMQEVTKADKKWRAPVEPFLKGHEHLAQLLTDAWWDDGSPREVCSLTVRVGLDQCQISVNDNEAKQSMTTTAETFAEALRLLDEAIGTGRNLWRKWQPFKARK